MSYSNRPSKFSDPTVRPNQAPFTPSARRESRLKLSAFKRKRNRQGVRYHGPGPDGVAL
jgi:hypothetical protein